MAMLPVEAADEPPEILVSQKRLRIREGLSNFLCVGMMQINARLSCR
jgi:hypothetical protein